MKNFVQPGNTITLTAPDAVASGDGLLVGSIFGIAAGAAALGELVETALVGVFDITKVGSQAWTVGAKIYWDDTNKRTTTVATDNTLIGVAVEAVAGGGGRRGRHRWSGTAERDVLMSAFAAAVGALFADPNVGRDAVYIADGGAPVLVRAVARRADAITDFGDARLWSETTRIDLRVAEVANPRPGDRIEIDGDAFLIQGEPVRDRERLVWTVDLRPA